MTTHANPVDEDFIPNPYGKHQNWDEEFTKLTALVHNDDANFTIRHYLGGQRGLQNNILATFFQKLTNELRRPENQFEPHQYREKARRVGEILGRINFDHPTNRRNRATKDRLEPSAPGRTDRPTISPNVRRGQEKDGDKGKGATPISGNIQEGGKGRVGKSRSKKDEKAKG